MKHFPLPLTLCIAVASSHANEPQLRIRRTGEAPVVDLPAGDFEFEINRARVNINFTPTLSWTNYLQQESETHVMTLQSQLRWIIVPGNELTVTLNHDWARDNGSYKRTEADLFAHLVWTHRF